MEHKQLYVKDNVIVSSTKLDTIHKVFLVETKTNFIKFIGIIDIHNKVYKKSVEECDHFFKKFNGYGISNTVLKMLKAFNITQVELTKVETGDTYNYPVVKFYDKNAIQYNNDGDIQQVLSIFESNEYIKT
jgi:hypothetical protein